MVKVNSKSQKGRSMVEMLGVLAIVGVLSVGGVYGYGVAMKKHKANEALHKASMLATTVSAYAMSNDGNLPSTITDFANLGYETSVTDDGTKFKLTLKDLDDGVCEQLQNLQGGMMREAICTGTTATLSYYKNLATNDIEGANSPTGGSSGGDSGEEGGEETKSCTSDIVKVYNCETKTTTDCCRDNGNTCEQPTNCTCSDDSDCPGAQICNDDKICECPYSEGLILGIDGKTCCTTNYYERREDGYFGNPKACGACPDAQVGAVMTSEGCCLAGYLFNDETALYDIYDSSVYCGCPNGGSYSVEGNTCCKNGYYWPEHQYDYVDYFPLGCGCPDGGMFGATGDVCCKGGKVYSEDTEGYTEDGTDLCDECPLFLEEEEVSKIDGICCSNGYAWNESKIRYSDFKPEVCGCPFAYGEQGDFKEGSVCCLNGYAWNPEYREYQIEDSRC